ncbi:cryptochrome/photolyase family protein [Aliikangiella sp. IMCC44653]
MHQLVWFRNDLRVADNPALARAMSNSDVPTVAVYLLCQKQWTEHLVGLNQQALILQALENLEKSLSQLQVPLIIIDSEDYASASTIINSLCGQLSVSKVYFNMEYPINERQRDQQVVNSLPDSVDCQRCIGDSLVAPWEVTNAENNGYKVFSAFARKFYELIQVSPLIVNSTPKPQASIKLPQLKGIKVIKNLPKINPTTPQLPEIKEKHLAARLKDFIHQDLVDYADQRDFPSVSGTSQLSVGLAVGAISVKQCFFSAQQIGTGKAKKWLDELVWRDFYRAVMWHFPRVSQNQAFNPVDKQINWSKNQQHYVEFTQAKTGVPIVDAAIQQLLTTGWMHNRLRMVVASYFCKNLWLDWRQGEAFFAQHLFDYDFASNNGGWQWCASVGTDAAPYFRVFNPASQQKRFDPNATFIKRWLPQLQSVDKKAIHRFESNQLANYPRMQVDLKASRKLAIETFKTAKNQSA